MTGEESTAQVRLRAERTNSLDDNLCTWPPRTTSAAILTHIDSVASRSVGDRGLDPDRSPRMRPIRRWGRAAWLRSGPWRRPWSRWRSPAASTTVLVGHVTKDGSIAGPRVLEHLVDVVLHFEGDRHSSLRLIAGGQEPLRRQPTRSGCFEMREDGIAGLADPSGLFLSRRNERGGRDLRDGHRSKGGGALLLTEVQSLGQSGNGYRRFPPGGRSPIWTPPGWPWSWPFCPNTARVPLGRVRRLRRQRGRVARRPNPRPTSRSPWPIHSAATVDRPIAAAAVCHRASSRLSGDVRPVGDLPRRLGGGRPVSASARPWFRPTTITLEDAGAGRNPAPAARRSTSAGSGWWRCRPWDEAIEAAAARRAGPGLARAGRLSPAPGRRHAYYSLEIWQFWLKRLR